jgi:hypothetical protein
MYPQISLLADRFSFTDANRGSEIPTLFEVEDPTSTTVYHSSIQTTFRFFPSPLYKVELAPWPTQLWASRLRYSFVSLLSSDSEVREEGMLTILHCQGFGRPGVRA